MMRVLKLALVSGASVLALCTSAAADPFTLGVSILSGVLSTTGVALAISPALLGSIALGIAVVGLQVAQAALMRPRGSNPGDFKSEFQASAIGAINAIGRVRVGGLKAFGNTSGFTRDRVIWHCKGEIVSIREYFLGGRSVIVENGGAVSSPPWGRSNGNSWAYVNTKFGTGDETTWPDLLSRYPALITSAFRARGIGQSHKVLISPGVTTAKFGQLYQSDADPDLEIIADVTKVYDPRTGLRSWTRNGVLCAAHILALDPSLTFDDFDWPRIGVEASKADVLGYQISGLWTDEDNRADVVKDALDSIGARVRFNADGKIWIEIIDDAPAAEITFLPDDIISIEGPGLTAAVSRPNILRLSYYSAERNYELAEIDISSQPWTSDTADRAAYGDKAFDIKLPFCPSHVQAQRIARRMFAMERTRTGVMVTNWAGLAAYGLKTAVIPLPEIGVSILAEIGAPRIREQEGAVEIPFREIPALSVWNTATDAAAAPDVVAEFGFSSDISKPATPEQGLAAQTGASAWETRVRIFRPAGANLDEARYRVIEPDGSPGLWQSMTELQTNDTTIRYARLAGDLRGQRVQFRSQSSNNDDEVSEPSDILDIPELGVGPAPTNLEVVSDSSQNSTNNSLSCTLVVRTNSLLASVVRFERQIDGGSFTFLSDSYIAPDGQVTLSNTASGLGLPPVVVNWRATVRNSNGISGPSVTATATRVSP